MPQKSGAKSLSIPLHFQSLQFLPPSIPHPKLHQRVRSLASTPAALCISATAIGPFHLTQQIIEQSVNNGNHGSTMAQPWFRPVSGVPTSNLQASNTRQRPQFASRPRRTPDCVMETVDWRNAELYSSPQRSTPLSHAEHLNSSSSRVHPRLRPPMSIWP